MATNKPLRYIASLFLLVLFFQLSALSFSDSDNKKLLNALSTQAIASEISQLVTEPCKVFILQDNKYFDTLINHIRAARQSIDIAVFLFKSNHPRSRPGMIIQELANASQRGVKVTVILERSKRDKNLNKENRKTAKFLEKNGVKVVYDSPSTTTHTKIVVVDRRYCFVGSHNFTQSAFKYNHELSLLVDSKDVAGKILEYVNTISR